MAKKKTKSTVPFEESLEALEEVVYQLENGNLTLGDSLEQYEQGVKHLKNCHKALKSAQRKIELLVKLDEDGNLITRDFDDSATEDVATGTRRASTPRKRKPKGTDGLDAEHAEFSADLDSETDGSAGDDDPTSLF